MVPCAGVTIGFVETMYDINEGDGTVTLTIAVLSGELSEDVVLNFATLPGTASGEIDRNTHSLTDHCLKLFQAHISNWPSPLLQTHFKHTSNTHPLTILLIHFTHTFIYSDTSLHSS